jgi:chromosome segregation ATPase
VQVTYPDLAEVLQARIRANLEAGKIAHTPPGGDERLRIDILQPHIAALEEAAEAEVLGEQRRQEGEQAAKQIAELELQISTLQEAIAKTEALGEQQHQKAQTSADRFLAEIIDMTGEFAEMSKQIREQTAEIDRLRAELDNYGPES